MKTFGFVKFKIFREVWHVEINGDGQMRDVCDKVENFVTGSWLDEPDFARVLLDVVLWTLGLAEKDQVEDLRGMNREQTERVGNFLAALEHLIVKSLENYEPNEAFRAFEAADEEWHNLAERYLNGEELTDEELEEVIHPDYNKIMERYRRTRQ